MLNAKPREDMCSHICSQFVSLSTRMKSRCNRKLVSRDTTTQRVHHIRLTLYFFPSLLPSWLHAHSSSRVETTSPHWRKGCLRSGMRDTSAITFMYRGPGREQTSFQVVPETHCKSLGSQQGRREGERGRDTIAAPGRGYRDKTAGDSGWSNIEVGTDLPMPGSGLA